MGQTRRTLPKSVSTQRRITNKRERLGERASEAVGGKRRTVALPPSRSHFFMDLYPCSAEPLRSILGDIDVLMARAWSFSGRMDALARLRHAIISDCNKRTQNTRSYSCRISKLWPRSLRPHRMGIIGHALFGANRICNLHIALKFSAFAWKWQSHSMTAADATDCECDCFASLLIQFNPLAGPKTARGKSLPFHLCL